MAVFEYFQFHFTRVFNWDVSTFYLLGIGLISCISWMCAKDERKWANKQSPLKKVFACNISFF